MSIRKSRHKGKLAFCFLPKTSSKSHDVKPRGGVHVNIAVPQLGVGMDWSDPYCNFPTISYMYVKWNKRPKLVSG